LYATRAGVDNEQYEEMLWIYVAAALCWIRASLGSEVILPRDIHYDSTLRIALDALQALDSRNATERDSALAVVDWSFSLRHALGRPDFFTMTLCGSKVGYSKTTLETNQDRAFVLEDANIGLKAGGVLDGHGSLGHHAAEFGRNEILLRLRKFLDTQPADEESITSWLETTLVSGVDKDIPGPVAENGGATVSMIIQLGKHVYMINAGDSKSFLLGACRCGHEANITTIVPHVLYETRLDKPDLPGEEERISRMGGRVSHSSEEDDARAWYTYIDASTGRPTTNGLAMSRGIGDRPFVGVIPDPLVHVVRIDDLLTRVLSSCANHSDERASEVAVSDLGEPQLMGQSSPRCDATNVRVLAVSATDGLIDYLSGADIAQALFNHEMHVFSSARHLFHKAANSWNKDMGGSYRDDMALSVFEIDKSPLTDKSG
jgi:serine/threonine protein phosphatase PrpC